MSPKGKSAGGPEDQNPPQLQTLYRRRKLSIYNRSTHLYKSTIDARGLATNCFIPYFNLLIIAMLHATLENQLHILKNSPLYVTMNPGNCIFHLPDPHYFKIAPAQLHSLHLPSQKTSKQHHTAALLTEKETNAENSTE
jgi:hypothetical protein